MKCKTLNMKKFTEHIFAFLSNAANIVYSVLAVAGSIAGYYGFLFKTVCLQWWLVAVIVVAPFVVYKILEMVLLRRKRKFKTGDCVKVFGDNRKFIVFDYSTWKPRRARLKQNNGNMTISIRDNFLLPWGEPSTADIQSDLIRNITDGQQIPHRATIHDF